MRKLLYTTSMTAVASAFALSVGTAQGSEKAQNLKLSVGGYFNAYVAIADQADSFESNSSATSRVGYDSFNVYNDSEIHFTGSTKLVNGVGVEVTVELETDQEKNGTQIDDSFLRLTGGFGDLRVGSTDAVTGVFAVSAPAAGATGPNDGDLGNSIIQPSAVSATADTLLGTDNSMKVTYLTPSFSGLQAGFSYEPSDATASNAMPSVGGTSGTDTQEYNIGIAYAGNVGSAEISADLSYKEDHGTAANSYSGFRGGLNLTAGQITVGGSFKKIDAIDSGIEGTSSSPEEEGFDVGIQYDGSSTSVSLSYLQSDMPLASGTTGDDSVEALTVGASYTVGPGIELLGTFARVEYSDEGTSDADNNDGWAVIAGVGVTF